MDITSAPAAPATADAQQGASSASTNGGLATAAQMNARAMELAAQARAPSPSTTTSAPAAVDAVPPAGVAEGENPASGEKPEEKQDKKAEKLIPQAVFQRRLGEVAAKRDAAIAEKHTLSLELAKHKAALAAATAEVEHFRAAAAEGRRMDPRDLQLYDYEADRKFSESLAEAAAKHEAQLAEFAKQQREALVVDRERAKLESELERALSQYSHIDQDSLLRAAEKRPSVPLVEIAKALDDAFRKRAEAAGYARQAPPAPPAPVTIRAPGGSAPTGRHPYSAAGMDNWVKDFIASRGQ